MSWAQDKSKIFLKEIMLKMGYKILKATFIFSKLMGKLNYRMEELHGYCSLD